MTFVRAASLAAIVLLSACGPSSANNIDGSDVQAESPKWRGAIREGRAIGSEEESPEPIILIYRVVAPSEAESLNAAMPVNTDPIVSAKAYSLPAALSSEERTAASDCLTAAIYYEAGSEDETDKRAVAQVVLNRLRHPAFPKSVCAVIFQGSERPTACQFTFTCDGALARQPVPARWAQARKYADQALAGYVEPSVGLSTHYHIKSIVPYWRSDLTKIATIGQHIFYRWQGGYGLARAGMQSSNEVLPAKLAAALPAFIHLPAGVDTFKSAPMLRADGQLAPLPEFTGRLLLDQPPAPERPRQALQR